MSCNSSGNYFYQCFFFLVLVTSSFFFPEVFVLDGRDNFLVVNHEIALYLVLFGIVSTMKKKADVN